MQIMLSSITCLRYGFAVEGIVHEPRHDFFSSIRSFSVVRVRSHENLHKNERKKTHILKCITDFSFYCTLFTPIKRKRMNKNECKLHCD